MLINNLLFFRKMKNIVDFIDSTPTEDIRVYGLDSNRELVRGGHMRLSDFKLSGNNTYEYVYNVFNFYSNSFAQTIYFEMSDGSKIGTLLERNETWEENGNETSSNSIG